MIYIQQQNRFIVPFHRLRYVSYLVTHIWVVAKTCSLVWTMCLKYSHSIVDHHWEGLVDHWMRKRIFTSASKSTPILKFDLTSCVILDCLPEETSIVSIQLSKLYVHLGVLTIGPDMLVLLLQTTRQMNTFLILLVIIWLNFIKAVKIFFGAHLVFNLLSWMETLFPMLLVLDFDLLPLAYSGKYSRLPLLCLVVRNLETQELLLDASSE